jgi:hypothetical protein
VTTLETIGLAIGLPAAALILRAMIRGRNELVPGTMGGLPPPREPCWTEEIGRDGNLVCGRAECVHDALIDLDRRAAAGEFGSY